MANAIVRSSLRMSSESASAWTNSASCYSRAEYVLVESVVVPEFKLRHVQRKILFADLMKRTHHATLEDRPEALDGVGVDCANDVLPLRVIDDFVWILFLQLPIAHPLIGHQQTHVIRHGFTHEAGQSLSLHVRNDASYHVALALNRSDHNRLPRSRSARAAVSVAVVPVLGLASNECFIHLNNTAQLGRVSCGQRYADAMAHIPGRLVRTEAHETEDLQGAHALLARQHEMGDLKPIHQRFVRVLVDRARDVREAILYGDRKSVV